MTESELAWAAGFFDGEGSVSITKDQYGCIRLNISIAQIHREILERFAAVAPGGQISGPLKPRPPGKKPIFYYRIQMASAVLAAIRSLSPFLCQPKRIQLESAVERYKERRLKRGPLTTNGYTHCPKGHLYGDAKPSTGKSKWRCHVCRLTTSRRYEAKKRVSSFGLRGSEYAPQRET